MEEDEFVSPEEDVFYDYTLPPEPSTEVPSDVSNITSELPSELASEVPQQLTGNGAESTLYSAITHLNTTFGIDIGDALIAIAITIIRIVIIIFATYFAAKIVNRTINVHLPRIIRADKIGLDVDQERTLCTLAARLFVAAVYIIGFLLVIYQIPPLNNVAVTLLAGAGVAGLAIGFAAQGSLANVISGVFLAVFNPFRVGDYVDFNGEYGRIEDLTLRHTVVLTWDGRRIMVPNSVMNEQSIINWTINDPEITWPIDIGIAYTADIDKAREIILNVARRHPLVLKNQDIIVRVTELGDFAVNLRLFINIPGRSVAYATGCDITESVKKKFDKEGIEIPYPYRNVIIQNSQNWENPEEKGKQAS